MEYQVKWIDGKTGEVLIPWARSCIWVNYIILRDYPDAIKLVRQIKNGQTISILY